ncbi:putative membrane protein [Wolbachia endosymbiont of Wuchereria bancrofti]|nr:putative membrane protein [Wolbachia endosymbiont of Wuchereria bancrofti]
MKQETDLTSFNNLITIAPKVFLITICFWPAGSITKFSKNSGVYWWVTSNYCSYMSFKFFYTQPNCV